MSASPPSPETAGGGDSGRGPHAGWSDRRLIGGCLRGDEQAWNALVDKYSQLIYAVVLRYGIEPDEAPDLFQTVWMNVHSDLAKLKKQSSLRSWLITVTRRRCYHWSQGKRRRQQLLVQSEVEDREPSVAPVDFGDLESDQRVRESIFQLPERCREMIQMLFFSDPPLPYRAVAQRLGLAVGSIGFIRGRCLRKLQRILEGKGLV